MASFNRVILLGNLTRDPELRHIQSGTAVTDLGLAVNEKRKGPNGDWIEEVTFVDVTAWARNAEIASEYLTKGSPVLIEGRLKLDTWEKDGQKHSKLKVVCDQLRLVGTRGGSGGDRSQSGSRPAQRSSGTSQQYNQSGPPEYVDDVPPREMSGGGGGGGGGDNGGDDIPF
ncbi:MAG: single-stranded DNA-binding protein [Planctomycetota bacterium]